MLAALLEEESVRVKGKIADGFIALGWEVPDESRDAVRKALPPQYSVDGAGLMSKRAGGFLASPPNPLSRSGRGGREDKAGKASAASS